MHVGLRLDIKWPRIRCPPGSAVMTDLLRSTPATHANHCHTALAISNGKPLQMLVHVSLSVTCNLQASMDVCQLQHHDVVVLLPATARRRSRWRAYTKFYQYRDIATAAPSRRHPEDVDTSPGGAHHQCFHSACDLEYPDTYVYIFIHSCTFP